MRAMLKWFYCSVVLLFTMGAYAQKPLPTITVATLSYGTVNWELQALKRAGLDKKHGFELAVREVNSPRAAAIALQAGEVAISVQDWLWVARQVNQGRRFYFAPYSTNVGELLVPEHSTATGLNDLTGMTIGIAGGSTDKSWQILQALYNEQTSRDLRDTVEPRFGSPPLLSTLLLRGDVDAVLTYWHYGARLRAKGYRSLMNMEQVLTQLGIEEPVPMLGWTIGESVVQTTPSLVEAFLRASREAKELLASDDTVWESLKPLMRVESEQEFILLRETFREGAPKPMNDAVYRALARVAALLPSDEPRGSTLGPPPRDLFLSLPD